MAVAATGTAVTVTVMATVVTDTATAVAGRETSSLRPAPRTAPTRMAMAVVEIGTVVTVTVMATVVTATATVVAGRAPKLDIYSSYPHRRCSTLRCGENGTAGAVRSFQCIGGNKMVLCTSILTKVASVDVNLLPYLNIYLSEYSR